MDTIAASQQDASVHVHHQAAEDRTGVRAQSRVGKSHFWRHFVQMSIAMVVGMVVLGMPFRAILGALGHTWGEAFASFPEIVCLVMTLNMGVGMVVWMRFRGHGWRTTAEMILAMSAAPAVALGMFWSHIVSEEPLIGLMHVLMLPAMLIAMLFRREEYSHAHL
jgi:flagellar biosynthetic protein FliP